MLKPWLYCPCHFHVLYSEFWDIYPNWKDMTVWQKIENAILGTQKNAQIVKVENISDGTLYPTFSLAIISPLFHFAWTIWQCNLLAFKFQTRCKTSRIREHQLLWRMTMWCACDHVSSCELIGTPIGKRSGKYLVAEVDGFLGRDTLEFLVRDDIVTYRSMANQVRYVYPFTTPLGDFDGQQKHIKTLGDELGWLLPDFDTIR